MSGCRVEAGKSIRNRYEREGKLNKGAKGLREVKECSLRKNVSTFRKHNLAKNSLIIANPLNCA